MKRRFFLTRTGRPDKKPPTQRPDRPFFVYLGNKVRHIPFFQQYLDAGIARCSKYLEPFVGSGAVLWHIQSHFKKLTINDICPEVIELYRALLRDDMSHFTEANAAILRIENALTNGVMLPLSDATTDSAAATIVRDVCYVYRGNMPRAGGMYPVCGYRRYWADVEHYAAHKDVLSHTEILCGDGVQLYRERASDPDTFTFLDPPYPDWSRYSCGNGADVRKQSMRIMKDLCDIMRTAASPTVLVLYKPKRKFDYGMFDGLHVTTYEKPMKKPPAGPGKLYYRHAVTGIVVSNFEN